MGISHTHTHTHTHTYHTNMPCMHKSKLILFQRKPLFSLRLKTHVQCFMRKERPLALGMPGHLLQLPVDSWGRVGGCQDTHCSCLWTDENPLGLAGGGLDQKELLGYVAS